MGFGMGLCCLQMTFQAVNMQEARWLYDQLTPITPVMVALSAGEIKNDDTNLHAQFKQHRFSVLIYRIWIPVGI